MPNKATNNEVIIYRMSEEKNMEGKSKTELVENFIEAARSGRLKITFKTFGDPDPDARLKAIKSQLERIREEVEKIRRKYSWDEATHKVLLDRAIASARAVGYPTHEHDEGGFYSAANSIPEINPKNRHILEHFARVVFFVVRQDVELIKQQEGELLRAYDDDPPTYTLTAQGELFPLTDADLPPILRRVTVLCARRTLERAWDVFPQLLGLIDRALNPQELSEDMGEVENVNTYFPTDYARPLSKPVNLAFTGVIDDAPQCVQLEGSKSKKTITAVASLTINKEKVPTLDNLPELDMYDKQVHNAIVALFEWQGGKSCVVTPQMIYGAMLANKNARLLPESQAYTRIMDSMKKLFGYVLDLDAEKDKDGNPKYNKLIPRRYFGPLLMGEYLEAEKTKINGQEIVGAFKIYRRPILDILACETKQRTVIPATLLKLSEKSATETVIILKNEIAERISWEKNAKTRNAKTRKEKSSFKIKYKPLYSLVGIPEENTQVNKNRRQKVRDVVREILNNHVKRKNIKGYIEIKGHGGAIEGAEIKL